MKELRKLVPLLALFWLATVGATDPSPDWGFWRANVENTYCELTREYHVPFRNDPTRYNPSRKGFLTGTEFNRLFVQFAANTQFGDDTHGVIRFHMYVYPEDPKATSERILEANLGGHRSEAKVVSGIHTFSLNEEESIQLLERFTDSQIVEFELNFAGGDRKQFEIYPSGNRTFYVWANMFQTCIQTHKGKRR